ncbi:MAG TPA: ABC transporter permease, partial [Chthoniobacteraceae bacterium]|nr:ABC transporter permease [Chthoniobacteraceae bacterium]
MTAFTVIRRSVRFYWRTHLGVILGAALGALVLTGALLVGDSVKATLVRQALARVGKTGVAMTGGDRFFRAALADAAGPEAAPVLMLRATVARADGGARVNAAQLLGVDARFWKLSPSGAAFDLPDDGVALNARLAQQLGVAAGDTVIVRVEKPGMFSRDAPLSGEEADIIALRVKVARVVDDEHYGRFALTASQVPPFTVFAPLAMVLEKLALVARANALLVRGNDVKTIGNLLEDTVVRDTYAIEAERRIEKALSLEDASLSLQDLPNNSGLELRTSRVFLDPPVVAAAPRGKDDRRVDSLTYFVNAIDGKSEILNPKSEVPSTPYSMVTAIETPSTGFLPAELADDEIVITQWLADDLGIGPGAKVTLKYFVMGERRQLEEKSREFTVLAVLPMSEPQLNSSWMPDFPGLKDAKNCRDWKPGFEIDMTKMRAKDNDYWEQFRGTPKAFVNLKAGQEMWGNRWGNVTSLRWPAGTDRAEIEKALREKLTPEMLGFQFVPLREQALAATKAPVDFGQLFVSFSFFLIVAAAVLTGLLFVFTLEQRNAEAGTLLALGLPPRLVRRMFLTEGALLALIGSVLGAACAVIYTKLVLRALATVWRGAVGAVEFEFALPPSTLAIGIASGVGVALLAMWLASRKQMRHSARELLSGVTEENTTRRKARGASQSGREAAPPRRRCTGQTEAGNWASQVPISGAGRGGGGESRGL